MKIFVNSSFCYSSGLLLKSSTLLQMISAYLITSNTYISNFSLAMAAYYCYLSLSASIAVCYCFSNSSFSIFFLVFLIAFYYYLLTLPPIGPKFFIILKYLLKFGFIDMALMFIIFLGLSCFLRDMLAFYILSQFTWMCWYCWNI